MRAKQTPYFYVCLYAIKGVYPKHSAACLDCKECGCTYHVVVPCAGLAHYFDGGIKHDAAYIHCCAECGNIPSVGGDLLAVPQNKPSDNKPSEVFVMPPSPKKEKHKCRCDLRSVIMVTGCQCGGA